MTEQQGDLVKFSPKLLWEANTAILSAFGVWKTVMSDSPQLLRFFYEIGVTAVALYALGFIPFLVGGFVGRWLGLRLRLSERDALLLTGAGAAIIGLPVFAWWRFKVLQVGYSGTDTIGHVCMAVIGLVAVLLPTYFFLRHRKQQAAGQASTNAD